MSEKRLLGIKPVDSHNKPKKKSKGERKAPGMKKPAREKTRQKTRKGLKLNPDENKKVYLAGYETINQEATLKELDIKPRPKGENLVHESLILPETNFIEEITEPYEITEPSKDEIKGHPAEKHPSFKNIAYQILHGKMNKKDKIIYAVGVILILVSIIGALK